MLFRLPLISLTFIFAAQGFAVEVLERDGESHKLSKRFEPSDIHDCLPKDHRTVEAAMSEVIDMLRVAERRLEHLLFWYANQTDIVHQPSDAVLGVTYATWETFMQRNLMAASVAVRYKTRAMMRMEEILTLINEMLKNLRPSDPRNRNTYHQGKLQIFCGTHWLQSFLPMDRTINPDTDFFDGRLPPLVAPDQVQYRDWVRLPYGKFETNIFDHKPIDLNAKPSMLSMQGMAGPYSSIIALNPQRFQYWNEPSEQPAPTQTMLKQRPYLLSVPEDQLHLGGFASFLSSELLNMLSILPDITGYGFQRNFYVLCNGLPNGQLFDHPATDEHRIPNRGHACATSVPLISPDRAVGSSRNFMYMVLALYQEDSDYSEGFERRVGGLH